MVPTRLEMLMMLPLCFRRWGRASYGEGQISHQHPRCGTETITPSAMACSWYARAPGGGSVSFLVFPSSLSFSLLLTPLSPLSFQVLFNVRPSSSWENLKAAQNRACSAQQENTFGSIQRLCGGCTKLCGQDVTCEPREMCPTFCHRLWPLLHKPDKPQ